MNRKLYNEITNTHLFEMEHNAFMNQASLFLTHYREMENGHSSDDNEDERYLLTASTGFSEKVYIGNAGSISRWEELDESDVVINVIHMSGPMMRNSVCTYGSLELRRLIMEAADCKQCIAQVFIVDTPGGSSFSKFDLLEATDYAKAKGQRLIMYVDGMVCSAGMAWAAMCHKRYARNGHCVFGCMGTFASFYTNKDKDVNTITQAMFHEIYASDSTLKNKAERDAAQGDDARMQQEVDKSNRQYIEIIRKGIPKVTEEQLKGEVYEAGEVLGTLCDGIRTFQQVIDEVLAEKGFRMNAPEGGLRSSHGGSGGLSERKKGGEEEPEDEDPESPGDPNRPVDPDDDGEPDDDGKPEKNSSTNQSKNIMSKKYEKIQQALEVESLESNKDNSLWLHEELADKLETALEDKERMKDTLEAKTTEIKNLNGVIAQLKEEVKQKTEEEEKHSQEAQEQATQAKDAQDKLQEKADELQKQLDEMRAERDGLTAERDDLKAKLEKAESDLNEMAAQPGQQELPDVSVDGQNRQEAVALPHTYQTVKEQREAKMKFMESIRALKK